MDLQMTTIFTYTYITTTSPGFAVNDAVGNFRLSGRRCVFIEILRIKLDKDILYGWLRLTHSIHRLSCQKDSELQAEPYC